jgi:hypothetical protein
MSTTFASESSTIPDLTVTDRCDRCGVDSFGTGISQAFVRVQMQSGFMLDFCGSHARRHLPALVAQGALVLDRTDRINEKPSPGAY